MRLELRYRLGEQDGVAMPAALGTALQERRVVVADRPAPGHVGRAARVAAGRAFTAVAARCARSSMLLHSVC